jgi:hypothetical protein
VNDISFDNFGGYLLTTASNSINFYQYRSWPKPQGVIRPYSQHHTVNARFSTSGRQILATSEQEGSLKVLKLK